MNIEPKFKIGDLVRHKYSRSNQKNDLLIAMEVLFIHTETCSAGTQIFYQCRMLFQILSSSFKEAAQLLDIAPSDKFEIKFREDEIVECPDDIKKLITEP